MAIRRLSEVTDLELESLIREAGYSGSLYEGDAEAANVVKFLISKAKKGSASAQAALDVIYQKRAETRRKGKKKTKKRPPKGTSSGHDTGSGGSRNSKRRQRIQKRMGK